jgi:hypothetical protein
MSTELGEIQVRQRYTFAEWQARVQALNRAIRQPDAASRPDPREDLPEDLPLARSLPSSFLAPDLRNKY